MQVVLILVGKVLSSHLKALFDAFTDSHTWDNHNELTPAISLIELVNGLDVGVSLTHTSFHLNGEV